MSDTEQHPAPQDGQPEGDWPEKMPMALARKFLAVSHTKLTQLVQTGVIRYERDPIDHRVKLLKKSDLEQFRQQRAWRSRHS